MAGKKGFFRFLWGSLDWLFPPVCAGCGRAGSRWCPSCQLSIQRVPEPICQVCGTPQSHEGICQSCHSARPPYEALRSWTVFEGPIRKALHSLKYRRNISLGETLAEELALFARNLDWKIDTVVPVPSGRQRLKERGYNQVALLAGPVAERLGVQYSTSILMRARETRSQVGLSLVERRNNVSGAFRADPALARGRNILVLDDLTTTGATLAACTEALKAADAGSIFALTLARALPHHGFQIV